MSTGSIPCPGTLLCKLRVVSDPRREEEVLPVISTLPFFFSNSLELSSPAQYLRADGRTVRRTGLSTQVLSLLKTLNSLKAILH